MKQNPKHSNAIAYLRQLCCSGLDKEIVIPEFLRAVQTVIPSGSNAFSGVDESLHSSYHILEFVDAELDEAPAVISDYFTAERINFAAACFRRHPVIPGWVALDEAFYNSDLYNLVNRRHAQHHALHATVLQNGQPIGVLSLYRPRQQKPFDSREQWLLVQLLPYLAHALRGGRQQRHPIWRAWIAGHDSHGHAGNDSLFDQRGQEFVGIGLSSGIILGCT